MPDEFVRWSLCIFQHLFGMGTNIADPQLVQEILSVRSDDYEKIEANNALKKLEAINLIAKLSFGLEGIIQKRSQRML
ncbi:hypothetical protein SUGI_0949160 [Cryptomeria japonica]|nr:hypothetical protein SUGI_0949160 [Cryptomeria japonica]